MPEIINGETIEEAIEREYAKGMGNMNLPKCKNISEKLYQDGLKNRPDMTKEEKRRLRTQSLLATDVEQMSQLVDRLSSENFQG